MPLPLPCLMLVTDRSLCAVPAGRQGGADGLGAAVEAAVQGGVDAVQLREKDPDGRSLPPEDLLPLARRLRQATLGRALLVVNGPLDVALAAGADGVHLPQSALPVRRPREAVPAGRQGFLVGRSVHSLEAARRAEAEGADYLIAGPVYETRSHPGREPAGLSLIEEITGSVRVPVLAIGGVTVGRVEEVVRAGASWVAVISAVLASTDRRAAAGELRRALDAAWAAVGAARL
ncbi:MAG: thiamine phosphate synthase [Dehalococcoidia bacterium]|nr:MAG: thiamine phosphate synthase [Dehalococcoidia bacterium]